MQPIAPTAPPPAAPDAPAAPSASALGDALPSAFAFGPPSGAPYPSLSHKDNRERWVKWGHAPRLLALRLPLLRGGRVAPGEDEAFLLDLFNAPSLRAHLQPLAAGGPTALRGACTRVRARRLAATATSLSFFDCLVPGVLGVSSAPPPGAPPGAPPAVFIRRRLEEPWEGVTIADHLREALVLPPEGDPEGADPSGSAECLQQPNRFSALFTPAQRSEWLWRAAKWVAAGGPMSQHEDEWTPYAAALRDLARDFLTVVKGGSGAGVGSGSSSGGGSSSGSGSGELSVVTTVWEVQGLEGMEGVGEAGGLAGGGGLFPTDSPHNVCWVFSDPVHRCVHILHSSFVPYW